MADPDMLISPYDEADPVSRYRHALGTFINEFTWMETMLFDLLCAVVGVSEEIGRAVFSGTRADDMTKLIRRCYEARGKRVEPWLERALSQISVLNTARNQAVHFATLGIEGDDKRVWTTNYFRYPKKGAKEIHVAPEDLHCMAKDAQIMAGYILTATFENQKPGSVPTLLSDMQGEQPAWHYTPPQPKIMGRKKWKAPQK